MRALHTGKVLTEPMYQTMISPDNLNDGTSVSYAKGLVNFSNYGHNEIAHGEESMASFLIHDIFLKRIYTSYV